MSTIKCGVRYFCLGALLIFIGSVLLCALGFTVVLPHVATEEWPQVWCNVTNATYDPRRCSCEQQQSDMASDLDAMDDKDASFDDNESCLGRYPCLQVYVTFNVTTQRPVYNSSDVIIEVYETSAMLYRTWSDTFHESCSLHECGDDEWNIKTARGFRTKHGRPGKVFSCFYDPNRAHTVILERVPRTYMIHAIVWPCICLAAGSFIWLGLCLGCWTIEMDRYKYRYPHRYPALDQRLM